MATKHTVEQGDCLEKIAHQYGFTPATIWDHPDNTRLREDRDPGVLAPGDVVVIPDPRLKTVTAAPAKRHTFVHKGVVSRFRVSLDLGDRDLSGVKYLLDIDDRTALYQGTLDDKGLVDHPIPPDAKHAELTLGDEVFQFDLGHLDPVLERTGQVERLRGLYYLEDGGDVSDKRLTAALSQFQRDNDLEPTGKADADTRDALVEKFGC